MPTPAPTPQGALPARTATTTQAAPYVDRVINEKEAAEDPRGAFASAEPEPRGRRSFSAILGLTSSTYSNGGGYREYSLELRGQRETLDYGIFDFIASGYLASNPGGVDNGFGSTLVGERNGNRFTVSQTRFSLNANTQMDNALGAVYTQGSPLVSRSFRNTLVSSPVLGISSRLYTSSGTELNFSSGRIGQFSGTGGAGFRATQGEMTGLGLQRRVNSQWGFGAQGWVVKGAQGVADHSSVGLAGDYSSPDARRRLQLRGIVDDRGRVALWFDGEERTATLFHHYGLYRYQQDVAWADYPIASGQQGAYWRADGRGVGRGYSMGAEYVENNIARTGGQPVTRTATAFGSVNQRLDRLSSVGGNLALRMTQSLAATNTVPAAAGTTPASSTGGSRVDGQVFMTRQMPIGVTRLQVNYGAGIRGNQDHSAGLQWDQEFARLGFSTTLSYGDEYTATLGHARRGTAALLLSPINIGDAAVSGNLNVYQLRSDNRATETGIQAAGNARWQIGRDWSLQATASWRRTRNPDLNVLGNPPGDEKVLMFYLRYDTVRGIPYYASNNAGPTASSRITGTIFFDENKDGVRQAAEKPAAGVTVVLDGVYRAVTDANGRFEFAPVGPGNHRVSLQVDRIPLPWGLLDDAPVSVQAAVRGATDVSFPLIRLNQ